jgi:hypothetical protein
MSVEFPFTDMQGRKRRPGVVLAIDSTDLLLARITTHVPRDQFDVSLEGWAAIGLPKPSAVRLVKLHPLMPDLSITPSAFCHRLIARSLRSLSSALA